MTIRKRWFRSVMAHLFFSFLISLTQQASQISIKAVCLHSLSFSGEWASVVNRIIELHKSVCEIIGSNFRSLISEHMLRIKFMSTCKTALRRRPEKTCGDMLTSVQVMACCRAATSYYMIQCYPRSISPYDVTRPQFVNIKTWAQTT